MTAKITLRSTGRDIEKTYQTILSRFKDGIPLDMQVDFELFQRIRTGIAEGDIPAEAVELIDGETTHRFDNFGMIINWPSHLMNCIPMMQQILQAGVKRRKLIQKPEIRKSSDAEK